MASHIERFELIEMLGRGGFAHTWKAKVLDEDLLDEWQEEIVALKIPLDREKEIALRKEIELNGGLYLRLNELESVNIVRYLGFDIFRNKVVMVMNYIADGNLRNIMGGKIGKWKKVEPEMGINIIKGTLSGLSIIHKNHIIHRDIKPENILIDGHSPRISDLGIGRILGPNEMASTFVGTIYYMSPEILYNQYKGKGASFNSDIWSIGVTFYEMIFGCLPYGINEKMGIGDITQIIRDENIELQFPDDVKVSPKLKRIIIKSLKRDPAERYKTADKMLADLEKLNSANEREIKRIVGEIQQLYYGTKNIDTVESKFSEITNKYPDSFCIYQSIGEFYNRRGYYESAIKYFEKGIQVDEEQAILYWGLAMAYNKNNQKKLAIKSIKKAIEYGLDKSLERYAKLLLKKLE